MLCERVALLGLRLRAHATRAAYVWLADQDWASPALVALARRAYFASRGPWLISP